jgi:tetratricopeptide (TPR) repeat protein
MKQQKPAAEPAEANTLKWLHGGRRWLARLALLTFAPPLTLVLLEGALRLFDFGYPTSFFVPARPGPGYVTNEKFAWQFFFKDTTLKPFLFKLAEAKPRDTVRICVLGESAAMGTPDPAFSFGRILEQGLRHCYPQKRFEVINAAMRGINSCAIRTITEAAAAHQVDLFIVYAGNNEIIGLHGPDPFTHPWTQSLTLLRVYQRLRSSKLSQLFDLIRPAAPKPETQDMPYFREHSLPADDPRRLRVYDNFRANLNDMCRTISRSGARTLLCTVPVNLQNCPPLQSLHRGDLRESDKANWDAKLRSAIQFESQANFEQAIAAYLEAAAIDDHYAELLFRLGGCYLAAGKVQLASKYYSLARDWDALQFRSDRLINQVIREVASSAGVTLLDVEKIFSETDDAEHGIPGEKLFYDHVHPTFAGNYLIARSCYDKVVEMLQLSTTNARANFPEQSTSANAVAYTPFNQLGEMSAFLRLSANPPFLDQLGHSERHDAAQAQYEKRNREFTPAMGELCIGVYQAAIQNEPGYWPLHYNLATLYQAAGRPGLEAEQLRWIVQEFPQVKRFRISLGNALLAAGDKPAAITQLKAAWLLDRTDRDLEQKIRELSG